MATAVNILQTDQLKGPERLADLHVIRVSATFTGTYLTATKPTFNILSALQNQHEGVTAVVVTRVTLLADYNDGTNVYTAPNANIVLSSVNANCTNDKVVFRVDSGATDGTAGAEISDGTSIAAGVFVFVIVCSMTGA